jgi:hypothetical protein
MLDGAMSLAKLDIESSVILLYYVQPYAIPLFSWFGFSHPAFSLSRCDARLVEGQEIEIDSKMPRSQFASAIP